MNDSVYSIGGSNFVPHLVGGADDLKPYGEQVEEGSDAINRILH